MLLLKSGIQSSTGSAKYLGDQFALKVVAPNLSPKRRRQAGSFVGYNGRTTTSCTQASVLTIYNGQLFISYANGTVAQFSANAGDAYDNFVPSTTSGSVTTTFSLSQSGTLLWNSPSFFNGNALFCLLPSGTIVAVFQQGAQPTSCDFIDLTIVELAGCVIPSGSSATLIPPNPSGPSGASGLPGPSGASGLPGPSGASGLPGPSGPSGATGLVGPSGATGLVGPSGAAGLVGPSGPSGASGLPGPSGPSGATGLVGPSGASGLAGPSGASGLAGPSGASGLPGSSGASGLPGPSGASGLPGPSGASGLAGPSGASGLAGPSGASGLAGPSGASGLPGPSGASGLAGPSGASGLPGPSGASGLAGSSGLAGPSGASGLPGPSGAPGIAYAYLGCFYQSGTSSTPTTGKVLSNFITTYTTSGNTQCSTYCNLRSNNFYGVTNTGTSVDCYCGDTLQYVTILNLGAGMAPDNNCGTCFGGPSPAGECGIETSNTVAIYARAY